MDSMKDVLEQQDAIAARVKLIETQIEGFKVQSVSSFVAKLLASSSSSVYSF